MSERVSLSACIGVGLFHGRGCLCLGGLVTEEKTALEIVDTFLKFDFEGGRHQRRIDQIADIENGRL